MDHYTLDMKNQWKLYESYAMKHQHMKTPWKYYIVI